MQGNRDALTFAAIHFTLVFVYNIIIGIYITGLRIAGLWNEKASEWSNGRTNLLEELKKKIERHKRIIWFHCASAGELEQAKPVIEQLKKVHPSHTVLVSFFSPSGFKAAKKYASADIITFLPADTKKNAAHFIEIVNPELVVFVKYEFWYHHITATASRNIPILLIDAIFRKEQVFFKWYGNFFREMLFQFRHIFVQDEGSLQLLQQFHIKNASVAGDTRFDRVLQIASNFEHIPFIEQFVLGKKSIIAGSTWKEDESALKKTWNDIKNPNWKLIIAPHEVDTKHIKEMGILFPTAIYFKPVTVDSIISKPDDILIINSMGLLSKLYFYAAITYIGGGFNTSGIHNTLEAAVFGKPVIFGPAYHKFKEARELIEVGGAYSISSEKELSIKISQLIKDPNTLDLAGKAARKYVEDHAGATKKILLLIQEKRLLTN